ncbi:MAG: right-handed parallel beta-helix repeat-containing protein, partial [Actinobacteria bacterium]|nr:right-handed parallel beta-helix repeat-containing protein [Actinomycetota bacterium]
MRSRLALCSAFALWVLFGVPGWAGAQEEGYTKVTALDDFFAPDVIRVPVGGEVEFVNDGRNPHTVTADDGSFDSGNMAPGDTFELDLDREGVIPFYCIYHGAPGVGMAGTILVGDVPLPAGTGGVGPGREEPPTSPGPTIRVPQDAATIQEAVDRAEPGGLVLVSPGVYHEAVRVTTPFITIRGTDRNEVILDGELTRPNGIHVLEADGVSIENMTARHYQLNGFYWTGVFGYRGSYLTAYANGDYGVYAFDSVYGRFELSFASGHPDSGFYIGQCDPCHAVITDVIAEDNGLGYSGTNASGELLIVNSEWRYNMAGIVPNTLDSELLPPQHDITIAGNWVHDNNNREAPAKAAPYSAIGYGIALPGTQGNLVTGNVVEDHERYGIIVIPNLDRNLWITEGNEVRGNLVRRSGQGDLALAAPSAGGDCFSDNTYSSSLPVAIQLTYGCGFRIGPTLGGELGITVEGLGYYIDTLDDDFPAGDWRDQPAPPAQEGMANPELAPPNPAIPETAVPGLVQIRTLDATLALAAPSAGGDCFSDNTYS